MAAKLFQKGLLPLEYEATTPPTGGRRPTAFWTLRIPDQHKPTSSGFAVFSSHEESEQQDHRKSTLVKPINTPITPLCTSLTTLTWEHVRNAQKIGFALADGLKSSAAPPVSVALSHFLKRWATAIQWDILMDTDHQ
ncbi:hypothetical protein EJ08DRAFT_663599 [Tothia fuscella]|uniref:Uncharacterized protein n=1 Tax=Tothia fuscella TaxID=1048955 RepID=A0A9P4NL93_9PEZI|nr:hypothetical protein EJ08DRAFT_663599 [Tothia fuscella]